MHSCLIIDDEKDKSDLMVKRMEGLFETICVTRTFAEGLEAAKANTYEFVLLDINLPDANGLKSAEILKDASPESEIILVTAYKRQHDASKLLSNRIIYYIVDMLDEMAMLPDLIELKRGLKGIRAYANA